MKILFQYPFNIIPFGVGDWGGGDLTLGGGGGEDVALGGGVVEGAAFLSSPP